MPRGAMVRYALAIFGAHLGFMPLFILLLPRRVEAVAPDATVEVLSWLLLLGGIVAGLAHLVAGHLGDRWFARFGSRNGLISIGAALLVLAYAALAFAMTVTALLLAVAFFQLALNCAFAPLGALLTDHFDDRVKGRMAGWMNAALPGSGLAIPPIAWLFPTDGTGGFLFIGIVAAVCMVPLLAVGPVSAMTTAENVQRGTGSARGPTVRGDFLLAWVARLLVQLGAAFVIGYLYLYITEISDRGPVGEARSPAAILALISAPTAILAVLTTLASGHGSDAWNRRRAPLAATALVLACGLGVLAAAGNLTQLLVAYALVQIGLSAFLSIDTALVAQLVAGDPRRGVLLGAMNLTNTLPAIIAPILALSLAGDQTLGPLLGTIYAASAVAVLASAGLLLGIRSVR